MKSVAIQRTLKVIDLNTVLMNHAELFSDQMHPSLMGEGLIVKKIANELKSSMHLSKDGF